MNGADRRAPHAAGRRVVVLGPLPPQRCGVSEHVAGLLEALDDEVELEALTYRECGRGPPLQIRASVRRLPTLFHPEQLAYARGISYTLAGTWAVAVRKRRADLVHAHCVLPQGLVGLAAYHARGIPYVYTSHGADYELQAGQNVALAAVCREVVAKAAIVTAVDKRAVERFRCMGAEVAHVPNAIRDRVFDRLSNLGRRSVVQRRLLFLGHVNEHKGIDVALTALAHLSQGGAGAAVPTLDVLGGSSHEGMAQALSLADELGIRNQVNFWGIVPDATPFFQSASALLQPSRREGMPTAVLESFAAGLPVIASSVGGLPEMLAGGQNGYLVPSGDAEAVASAVDEVWSGGPPVSAKVAAAFGFARAHAASRVYRKFLEVYDRALAKTG